MPQDPYDESELVLLMFYRILPFILTTSPEKRCGSTGAQLSRHTVRVFGWWEEAGVLREDPPGQHAYSKPEGLNVGPSCCEVTALNTTPLCCPEEYLSTVKIKKFDPFLMSSSLLTLGEATTPLINNSGVELKFLRVQIKDSLSWSLHIETQVKKKL